MLVAAAPQRRFVSTSSRTTRLVTAPLALELGARSRQLTVDVELRPLEALSAQGAHPGLLDELLSSMTLTEVTQ